mmetsp:Transcript_52649/g.157719  ORF Transcript_52649/g.157719 Transcript_52649/m.157719 type:complete len:565 (-) Transcript_52649:176-1870(-)
MSAKSEKERQHDELLAKMEDAKKKWDAEDASGSDGPGQTDALLSQAIELALEQGKGWKPGEKEEYMSKILDDDYIPPLFAEDMAEVEGSGLAEAFEALQYDDPPVTMMLEAKKKGNESFVSGKKNVAKNVQYYRDAANKYYEALFFADRVVALKEGDVPAENEVGPFFSEKELDEMKSTLRSNAAMAHLMLKNWGHVRNDAGKAVKLDPANVKAWYRLAKACAMLKDYEGAGDAIEKGLQAAETSKKGDKSSTAAGEKELKKLESQLEKQIRRARVDRERREKARRVRAEAVESIWSYCSDAGVRLGRVPLVSAGEEDDDNDDETANDGDDDGTENCWHHHHPHTGRLPKRLGGSMAWPTMFLYPSHRQSDFVDGLAEEEMIAMRMAEMFPESEDNDSGETDIVWDHNNEFVCSKLAVYFEVHCIPSDVNTKGEGKMLLHPDQVEELTSRGDAARFYESARALRGDEGEALSTVAGCAERVRLARQKKAWKAKHGSLWCRPDPCPVVRVHPVVTLEQVLRDSRMVVPNFLVTFLLFPEDHPAHKEFLKERRCLGVLQPEGAEQQ